MQSYETGLSVTKTGFFVLSWKVLPGARQYRNGGAADRCRRCRSAVALSLSGGVVAQRWRCRSVVALPLSGALSLNDNQAVPSETVRFRKTYPA